MVIISAFPVSHSKIALQMTKNRNDAELKTVTIFLQRTIGLESDWRCNQHK